MNLTLDEFVQKWNGKQLEVAGSANAKYQCVDLVNGYFRDVLNLPIIEWTNAKDFPERVSTEHFDWILKDSNTVPTKGDVPVWNGRVGGGAGHIAICLDNANIASFKSFDQNWSKPLFCTIENHNYSNIRGWLRPKTKQESVDTNKIVTSVEQITYDILMGMKGQTSPDEHKAWQKKYVNPMQMISEISNNDESYKMLVAKPYVDALKKALNTEKIESEAKWQTEVKTANEKYIKLLKKGVNSISFLDFIIIKLFGGDSK